MRRILLIIFGLFVLPIFLQARSIEVSYQKVKNGSLNTADKVDSIYNLIITATAKDTSFIDFICRDFFVFAEKTKQKNVLGYAYLLQGNLDKKNEQNAKAITHFLKAVNLLDTVLQRKKLCFAYHSLAYLYNRTNNFALAAKPMQKALEIATEIKDNPLLFELYNTIGISYIREKKFDNAIDFYRKAIAIASAENNKLQLSKVFTNLGIAFRNQELWDSALFYNNWSLKLAKETNNNFNIAFALNDIGVIYSRIDDYDKALVYLYQSAKLREQAGETYELGFTYNFIAECLINQGKFEETEKYARKAVAVSYLSNNVRQRYESYEVLSVVFQLKNQLDSAFNYLQKHTMLKEKFQRERNKFAIDALVASYQFEEKEKEIKLLNEISEKQELQIQKQNLFLIAGFGGAFLFLIIVLLVIRDRKQKNNKLILEAKLKEEALKREAGERLQKEKERISRDLHDNVGGQLSYALYSLDSIQTDDAAKRKEIAHSVNVSLRNVIGNLRETIWAINDEKVSINDFSDKLKVYTRTMFRNTSTIISFQETIEIDLQLNSLLGLNLYRICQEIINNAFKYAKAADLKINIQAGEQLIVEISDNGVGFDLTAISKDSFGLANIQSRASETGIQLSIHAIPNLGVAYTLILPKI